MLSQHTHTENRGEIDSGKKILIVMIRNGDAYYTGRTIDFTIVHTFKKSTEKLINNQ